MFNFFILYILTLFVLSIFSYGFVDPNFPLIPLRPLYNLINFQRTLTTIIYIFLVTLLFGTYGYLLRQSRKRKINESQVWFLIFISVAILFFSFPAFSYDIFNYMATAKVTFLYKENPYLIMPIEFLGEPLLKFMHAANKTALYGPVWILLTAIPHIAGFGNLFLTIFTFKAFVAPFYVWAIWLIWQLSGKDLFSVVFFALNPLILIETLVSAHNDIVMMTLALLAFYLNLKKKQTIIVFLVLLFSIGIKYATIVLFPVFLLSKRFPKEQIFTVSYWLMFLIFLASPIREEIYPWYVIWLLTFAALTPRDSFIFWLTLSLSLGTLLRYVPFLYSGGWEGAMPLIKRIVTIIPPALVIFSFFFKEKLLPKKIFLLAKQKILK